MGHQKRPPGGRAERGKKSKVTDQLLRDVAEAARKVKGMAARLPKKFRGAREALRTIRQNFAKILAEGGGDEAPEALRIRTENLIKKAQTICADTVSAQKRLAATINLMQQGQDPIAPVAAKAAAKKRKEKTLPLPAEEPERTTTVRRRTGADPQADAFQQEFFPEA